MQITCPECLGDGGEEVYNRFISPLPRLVPCKVCEGWGTIEKGEDDYPHPVRICEKGAQGPLCRG